MKPLISVVIPVYNVEKYLRQCLDSVINQTYKNIEIICVNDCSTDSSPEILKEYADKITIIKNPKNLGLGLSRNEGIKIANGEFIHCLDSDDWMELNAYEILSKYLDDTIDGIRFTNTSFDETTGKSEAASYFRYEFLYKKVNIYNTPECFRIWNSSAWIKILRKDFILENNLFYNDYRCLEDIEYAMRAALKAKNLIFIEDSLLCYRANRKGSLLTKKAHYIDNIVKDTKWANQIAEALPENVRAEILNYIYELLIHNCLDSYYFKVLPFKKMQEIFINYIDTSFIQNAYTHKLTEKVIADKEIKFFLSYNIKRFLKERFPLLTNNYLRMKKRLLKWMTK